MIDKRKATGTDRTAKQKEGAKKAAAKNKTTPKRQSQTFPTTGSQGHAERDAAGVRATGLHSKKQK